MSEQQSDSYDDCDDVSDDLDAFADQIGVTFEADGEPQELDFDRS